MDSSTSSSALSLRRLARHVFVTLWIPVLAFALLFLAGWLRSANQPDTYAATTSLVFSANKEFDPLNQNTSYDNARFISNQAQVLVSSDVLTTAKDKLQTPRTVEELRNQVTAEALKDGGVVRVSATASNGAEAASVVNAVTDAYSTYILQRVQTLVKNVQAQATYGTATERATLSNDVLAKAALYGDGLSVHEKAIAPSAPIGPQPLRDAVFLGLAGGLGALAVLVLLFALRPRVSTARDIQDVLEIPLLADARGDDGPRQLTAGLQALHYQADCRPQVFMISPGDPRTDAHVSGLQMASSLSQQGISTEVVELASLNSPADVALAHTERNITLVPVPGRSMDPRALALAKYSDGVILVSDKGLDVNAAQDLKARAKRTHTQVVGCVLMPSEPSRTPPAASTANATKANSTGRWMGVRASGEG